MMCENGNKLDAWFDKASKELNEDLSIGNGIRLSNPLRQVSETIRPQVIEVEEENKVKLLEYDRRWRLLGLSLRDIDMRLSYNNPAYDHYLNGNTEHPGKEKKGIMRLGYFGDGVYFNSYNDGSTTTDELIAGTLLQQLVKENELLQKWLRAKTKDISINYEESYFDQAGEFQTQRFENKFYNPVNHELHLWGLVEKYGKFPVRYSLDKDFFHKMDSHGKWISLPYDPAIAEDHHRDGWTSSKPFSKIRNAVCDSLEGVLLNREPNQ